MNSFCEEFLCGRVVLKMLGADLSTIIIWNYYLICHQVHFHCLSITTPTIHACAQILYYFSDTFVSAVEPITSLQILISYWMSVTISIHSLWALSLTKFRRKIMHLLKHIPR